MRSVLKVNGSEIEYTETMELCELLEFLELSNQICAVEVNQTLVPHHERSQYKLNEGDAIEIVKLVGGG